MGRQIAAFPGWSANPYINLLYLAPRCAGWNVETPKSVDELWRAVENFSRGDVIHVHWLSPVFAGAPDAATAERQSRDFRGKIDRLLNKGIRLFWTIHNVTAHDSAFYDQEVALSQYLSDRSELIFVLNSATVEVTAPHYSVPPDKVRLLLHSSYQGVYPQGDTQEEARSRLGIASDVPVVGFVGQARPYKGIDTLLQAATLLIPRVPELVVLVRGKTPEDEMARLRASVENCGADVRWDPTFVPDDELQTWLRASDVIALPYARVLNSGSVYLSATFGVPCVLPREKQFESLFATEDWVTYFERDTGAPGLADALLSALAKSGFARESAEAFARRRTPFEMSCEYLGFIAH